MRAGPYAVVLEFRSVESLDGLTPGRLHGAFLGMLSRGDRALAKILHSPKLGQRPFSLHPLGNLKGSGKLRLRLSIIAPELFSRFWERWDKRGGIPLKLGKTLLKPTRLSTDGPWCGHLPWTEFLNLESRKEVELVFATPTAFRAGDLDLPLPVPRLVFSGLLRKWNAFSPLPLEIPLEEVERKVALSQADLRTKGFFDGRSHIVGFVGRARFRALRGSSPQLVRAMNALARFATFAGVGRKTTHGMGLVRVIEP
ncbi:CRISPR system precrRNA processing endoribonuclease RAMP protein Cas6 [Candidatus Bipolaricaulota bacterium]|nr:CRISPR system precrRNA processing endoribonuclease RAMP protein Cas6 [Candidatus Bipolaricaulota bacterium]